MDCRTIPILDIAMQSDWSTYSIEVILSNTIVYSLRSFRATFTGQTITSILRQAMSSRVWFNAYTSSSMTHQSIPHRRNAYLLSTERANHCVNLSTHMTWQSLRSGHWGNMIASRQSFCQVYHTVSECFESHFYDFFLLHFYSWWRGRSLHWICCQVNSQSIQFQRTHRIRYNQSGWSI